MSSSQRRHPSGIPGIYYGVARPRLTFVSEVDGHRIELDQFQVSSALTLQLLRASRGAVRLPKASWNRAVREVMQGIRFGLDHEVSKEGDLLRFYLHEHGAVLVVDVRADEDGGLSLSEPTKLPPPRHGLSGDLEVDRHIAFVLALTRLSNGVLDTSAGFFTLAAYDVQQGHPWRALPETHGDDIVVRLFEGREAPHIARFGRFGPKAGQ